MIYLKKLAMFFIFFSYLHVCAQEFALEKEKSQITWTGKAAFNTYSLTGSLTVHNGTILIENDTIKEMQITVNMKSLDHDNNDLKRHLRSSDFFEVNTYDEAQFILRSSASISSGKASITGDLTIKNNTNSETIDIEITVGESFLILNLSKSLDRTKYGIQHNSPSFYKNMKENAIADDFILKASLGFVER